MTQEEIFSNTSQVLMSPATQIKPDQKKKLSPQAIESFRALWVDAVKAIPLPNWCEPEKLADYLSHETEAYYIEKRLDERYERILKESRNIGEAFISYATAMEDYSKAMMAVLRDELSRRPKSFYRSDLPLSVLTKFDLLKHTQIQAYDCLWKHLQRFVGKASMYRGDNVKFRTHVTVPSSPVTKRLVDAYNISDKTSSSLLAYIRIWNVSSYEELFQDKPLSIQRLDLRTYSEFYQEFETKLYALRNVLLDLTPETYTVPVASSPATKMLGELLLSERSIAAAND